MQPGGVLTVLAAAGMLAVILRQFAPAVLQVAHAQAPRQRLRRAVERLAHGRAAAGDAAIYAKRQRDQR